MAFIVLEHKGIIQCEVYMCVTIWKIFMYFFMWLYVFFLKFSWRQTWVTKEKGLALFVLKRWIWLISNWSHANVVMRFCPFLLLLNLEIFQLLHLEVETVCFQGFSVIHLSYSFWFLELSTENDYSIVVFYLIANSWLYSTQAIFLTRRSILWGSDIRQREKTTQP